MTSEMRAYLRSDDPEAQRLAAWIKREVDRAPPLSPEQIEVLRGLLPFPGSGSDSSSPTAA
ncbi:MAG: hypothetical protein ACRDRY_10305 [Pseudonocardiaceae bacterium]